MKIRTTKPGLWVCAFASLCMTAAGAAAQVTQAVQMRPILFREIGGMVNDHANPSLSKTLSPSTPSAQFQALRSFQTPLEATPRAEARAKAAEIVAGLLTHPEQIAAQRDSLVSNLGEKTVQALERQARQMQDRAGRSWIERLQQEFPTVDIDAAAKKLQSAYDGWSEHWSQAESIPAMTAAAGMTARQTYTLRKPNGSLHSSVTYEFKSDFEIGPRRWLQIGSHPLMDPLSAKAGDLERRKGRLNRHTTLDLIFSLSPATAGLLLVPVSVVAPSFASEISADGLASFAATCATASLMLVPFAYLIGNAGGAQPYPVGNTTENPQELIATLKRAAQTEKSNAPTLLIPAALISVLGAALSNAGVAEQDPVRSAVGVLLGILCAAGSFFLLGAYRGVQKSAEYADLEAELVRLEGIPKRD